MGKCLAKILSLAVTVVSKLRLRNSIAYKPEAYVVKFGPGWALAQSIAMKYRLEQLD